MINNKLTINYKKSCYVIVSKRTLDTSNFLMFLLITKKSKKNYVKYLDVYFDDKLTWKNQIDHLCSKLSKVCSMVFKAETLCSTIYIKIGILFIISFQY